MKPLSRQQIPIATPATIASQGQQRGHGLKGNNAGRSVAELLVIDRTVSSAVCGLRDTPIVG
ncbi:hypothetical protein KQ313_02675 [Synechococcus sp. CS-1325]|uniref:hypothetical protein n=1 Tax=unclassified Synechococcus TaxID=2626047 RepID=UPI0021A8625E|nr:MULTISPECIES: hypothetical protein [unclassified Synechococcus]MCT0198589.1 hypothetical protein [Synechococcus sp. CS-1325]MCT0212806.1 hypothetical protein [Synechococcus sp. CS-1326]MCT0232638.1 hypothetical protein [Synechococcus sp. CS-1327]